MLFTSLGVDGAVAYVNIRDAQALFGKDVELGEHLRLRDIYDAVSVSRRLEALLGPDYFVSNWTTQFGPLSHAGYGKNNVVFHLASDCRCCSI